MVNFTFRGLMAPVFTPFNDDRERSLNLAIIPEYARYLKQSGVEGILVNGTTGEGVSQNVDEREKTAEAWMDACRNTGQTVMIQVGGTNLSDVCRLAAHAERLGASSILCLADLFHQPRSARDLLLYLQQVGRAAPNTPLLYYHIPGFTGIDVNMKELLELAEKGDIAIPTFVGLKFTCNDLSMGASLLSVNPNKYAVFLGSDTILAGALCLGFDSAIGTTLNMMADLNKSIVNSIADNNVTSARQSQRTLSAAIGVIARYGSWVGTMKSAMRALTKIDVGPVRQPLIDLTPQEVHEMKTDLQNLHLKF